MKWEIFLARKDGKAQRRKENPEKRFTLVPLREKSFPA
jgi:hypothetical protein